MPFLRMGDEQRVGKKGGECGEVLGEAVGNEDRMGVETEGPEPTVGNKTLWVVEGSRQ